MQLHKIIILCMMVSAMLAQQPKIIDFTYAHVLQETGSTNQKNDKIIIFPDTKQIEKYSFPEICQLKEKLDQGMNQTSASTSFIDVDQHLNHLRSKILQLLRITEDIKKTRSFLVQIKENHQIGQGPANVTIFSSNLKMLAERQIQLAKLKNKIENLTSTLNGLIEQYNQNPKNQQFTEVNLNYKLSLANSKLQFYNNLKDKILNEKNKQKPQNYNDFFNELENQFKKVNSHLNDIDAVINHYAYKKNLQERISSMSNKIAIDQLLEKEKLDCTNSKRKIKSHNTFNEEIKKTFQDLREKKKEFKGMNNTHCEGVAKKVEEKIRNELKIINRAYMCSEGLEDIQIGLRAKQEKLRELQSEYDKLKLGELEVYHKNYTKTVDQIAQEIEIMKQFTVSKYTHNASEIDKLIKEALSTKDTIEQKLKSLPTQVKPSTSIQDLENVVQQIKRLKAKYCQQYENYEKEARQLWNSIHKFQKTQKQLNYARNQYLSYGIKLSELQRNYRLISSQIIDFLQQSQTIN